MKKILHPYYRFIKRLGLLILSILFFIVQSFAGDISVALRYRIEIAMEDIEQPVVAEISNSESFPVEGAALSLTIREKLSLDIAYQYSTDIGTVEPNSSVTLKAPNPWIPEAGLYIINYQLFSSNDINPTNDTLSYEIEVKPYFGLGIRFNQLNFKNPFQQENSSTGRVDFKIDPEVAEHYLNVVINQPGSSMQPQWLVQNLPIPAFPDTQEISYWIDMAKIDIMDGMRIPYLSFDYLMTEAPIKESFTTSKMYLTEVFEGEYNVGGDISFEGSIGSYFDIAPIDWNKDFKVKTWNYRGCTVPNIDLDSSIYNPREMEGEVGDWNSCGPASAINSLQWLEDTNDKIPKTGTTIRDKLKIFNEVSKRQNENGLNTTGVIKGKLAFIDSLKLPIHVKWQGVPYDTIIASPNNKYNHSAENKNDSIGAYPTFEWLVSEIEKGEDVEIKFGWYDTLNVRHGGHWVVVSGVSDVTIAQGVYVKDDEEQGKAGGMRQTYLNWVTDEKGRPQLVGFKGKNNRCWVESVVSESYDSTITFVTTSVTTIPTNHKLNLNVYENPSPRTKPISIDFELSAPGKVQINIFEISGRLVFNEEVNYAISGLKTFEWNGNDNNGKLSESGIYLVKVTNGSLSATAKFIRQD